MTSLFVVFLVLAAAAALVAQLVWWLSGRPESQRVPPPLVVPIHPRFARQPEAVPPMSAAPIETTLAATAELPVPVHTSTTTVLASAPSDLSFAPDTANAASTETVQFTRPSDEALQLLPARLEVVSGMSQQQVIRFTRIPGKPTELILGRERASSPQQVTLTSRTVSRRHARVAYADGRWLVSNLSHTNPVVVNDQALDEFEGARPLSDGDRIELGDVVLRFCSS